MRWFRDINPKVTWRRVLANEGARTYFDTNVSDHHHFFVEGKNEVMDVPIGNLTMANLPQPPADMEIAHVDVVHSAVPNQALTVVLA